MKEFLKRTVYNLLYKLFQKTEEYKVQQHKLRLGIDPSVQLGKVDFIGNNIIIRKHTYINQGLVSSGENSKVEIGKYCAIGRQVHISSKTHSLKNPTKDEVNEFHGVNEKDIKIGDYVWIGDNVFIREGIKVGDYAIIAANAVVNRDVLPFEIVGGVPIKHIRFNTEHYRYQQS